MATYSASAVANFFLKKGFEESRALTQMQVMKLVYIAHGWHLALTGQPLIDEVIEAWRLGPVVKSLRHKFARFGNKPINELALEYDPFAGEDSQPYAPSVDCNRYPTNVILERVWGIYKDLTASQLIQITHEADSPWSQHFTGPYKGDVIPDSTIQKHYTALIKDILSDESRICG